MTNTLSAYRLALRAAGFDPIPVIGKEPRIKDWPALHAVSDELIDRRGPLEARVDLDQRFGPVALLRVDRPNLVADVVGVDGRERRRELLVLTDDSVAE